MPLWFLPICLLAAPAAAQTSSSPSDIRETVIVTGTAEPVTFESLSRSVTVITREQVRLLPATTVADVLRLVAGVSVRARGERGVQSDFSIRGAGFGQTLVLVDGIRINDSQSGHHNGDIPVPLDGIDRIEVLPGAGSSLHGADAFGGTINVITRRAAPGAELALAGGRFGFVEATGAAAFTSGGVGEVVAGVANRSAGFMPARDFQTTGLTSRTTFGDRTHLLAGYVAKEFGANGFYGNSPSKEWTNQTLVAGDRLWTRGRWNVQSTISYRTHGDRFLWDMRRPGVLENIHRTHALAGTLRASRAMARGTRASIGAESGGDWIRSTNLGNHAVARGSAFGELLHPLGTRAGIAAGLRFDRYTTFGSAWSPSIGGHAWVAPAVKLRGSVGRAFRVPTFTELYYRDPNHQARSGLVPEHATVAEMGGDWLLGAGWLITSTVFDRHERGVIDWLRASTTEKWETHNLRRVRTTGIELGARRTLGDRGFFQVNATAMSQSADAIGLLSKYVLDYSPRSLSGAALLKLPGGIHLAPRLEFTRRANGREWWLLDARISRRFGRADLFVDGTNLLDSRYEEIVGVIATPWSVSAGMRLH